MDYSKLDRHPVITSANDVNELIKPFASSLKLNMFYYAQINDDKTYSLLISNPDWFSHFYSKNYQFNNGVLLAPGRYVGCVSSAEVTKDMRGSFNLHHPCTFVRKFNGGFENAGFVAGYDNSEINRVYVEHSHLFEQYLDYFRHAAKELIDKSKQQPLKFSQPLQAPVTEGIDNVNKLLKNELAVNKHMFQLDNKTQVQLTQVEMQVLRRVQQKLTAKEIAKAISLSYRTVEGHIHSLKTKLNCNTKQELEQLEL